MYICRNSSKYKPVTEQLGQWFVLLKSNFLIQPVWHRVGIKQIKMHGFHSILTAYESLREEWKSHSPLHHQSGWKQIPEHIRQRVYLMRSYGAWRVTSETSCDRKSLTKSHLVSNASISWENYCIGRREKTVVFKCFKTRYWEILMGWNLPTAFQTLKTIGSAPTWLPNSAEKHITQNQPWRPSRFLVPTKWSGWLKKIIMLSLNE